MRADRFLIVHRSYDPIQAELLGELLRENGIAARVIGTRSAALVGVGPNAMQVHIEVPASQAGVATDFLESFFAQKGEELLRAEGLLDGDDEAQPEEPGEGPVACAEGSSRLLAAGCALLTFGLAHVYVGRRWTALLLAGAEVGGIYYLSRSAVWGEFAASAVFLAGLVAADFVGAQLALRSDCRPAPRTVAFQLGAGAAFVLICLAAGAAIGPLLPVPRR
jgi:hypothetical protein